VAGDARQAPRGGPGPAGEGRPPAGMVLFVVRPPIDRSDIPGVCDRLSRLLSRCADGIVVADLADLVDVDAVTVDLVARLHLTAIRRGRQVQLHGAGPRLVQLLALVGLTHLSQLNDTGVESRRQAEEREQLGRVEERVDPDDPAG
jgi:ABC-type transporter Mla MlaB component